MNLSLSAQRPQRIISLTEYTEDAEIKYFSIAVEKDGNGKAFCPQKSGLKLTR